MYMFFFEYNFEGVFYNYHNLLNDVLKMAILFIDEAAIYAANPIFEIVEMI
jgi:hypothetical protein